MRPSNPNCIVPTKGPSYVPNDDIYLVTYKQWQDTEGIEQTDLFRSKSKLLETISKWKLLNNPIVIVDVRKI